MQSDQQHLFQNAKPPLADQAGSGYIPNPHIASLFRKNVEFQASNICPRNFIIFDRTDSHSQIMYHPAVGPAFGHPDVTCIENKTVVRNDVKTPKEVHSVMKEDSKDIDFLLSFEEEYEDEVCEEEEVSTARTHITDSNDTADSWSSRPRKSRLAISSYSHKSRGSSEKEREKLSKMVNSLRGIVPDGNRLNTVAVIDEAVKYLNSLKVELQKAGGGNLKN